MLDISILTPIKNANPAYFEDYEKQILKIVKLGPSFELIFAVDNEEDQTFQLARGFKEKHPDLPVKIASLGGQTGISRSRNACMAAAEGKLIWFADYDDVFCLDGLKKLFDVALGREDVNTFCGKIERLFNGKLEEVDHSLYASLDGKVVDNRETIQKVLDFQNIGLMRFVFRRSFVEQAGIEFNLNVSPMEDVEFLYRFFSKHPKLLVVNALVYRYVKHETLIGWRDKWDVLNPRNPSRIIASLAKSCFLDSSFKI